MAKAKSDPTDKQKATLDARQKLELANTALNGKPDDAKLKAAVEAAKAVLKTTQESENRERFINVVGARVKKSRAAIRNVGNVTLRSYSFTESDVAKAETTLNDEVKKAIAKMRAALTSPGAVKKAEDDFTF